MTMRTVDPDSPAFEGHRREILVHCYRMTASFADAEDLAQETFLRAWRSRDEFDGRASARTWLYRIATNACLDFLKRHERRSLPSGSVLDTLERDADIQPFPDVAPTGLSRAGDPADAVVQAETTGLLLLAALRRLPPRQRAAFIARDVLAFGADEAAVLLDCSTTSVNSLVGRARRAIRSHTAPHPPPPAGPEDEAIVSQYVAAHHRADVDALVALVVADIRIGMPPEPPCRGMDEARSFFSQILGPQRSGDWMLLPTRANGAPATANYLRRPDDAVFHATSVDVLQVRDGRVEAITCFLGPRTFPAFGLPLTQGG